MGYLEQDQIRTKNRCVSSIMESVSYMEKPGAIYTCNNPVLPIINTVVSKVEARNAVTRKLSWHRRLGYTEITLLDFTCPISSS